MVDVRRPRVECGKKLLQLPCFFASVSSVKTNFAPGDYVEFLEGIGFPTYMISTYDVAKAEDRSDEESPIQLPAKEDRDSIVIADSGNYEAYWLRDRDWSISQYFDALKTIDPDMILSFDDPWEKAQPRNHLSPPGNRVLKGVIPIVHGNPSNLFDRVVQTAEKTSPEIIAVPERELGDGILQRIGTLRRIRNELDAANLPTSIHLLGTGNPRSILLYAAFGADSFDGIEWCQTVVDTETAYLVHFAQRDLIECDCPACSAGGSSYSAVTLGHNLLFYIDWISTIRESLRKGNIADLLKEFFSGEILQRLEGVD